MQPNSETPLRRYGYDPLDQLVTITPSARANIQRFYLKGRLSTEVQDELQRSIMQHQAQLLAARQCQPHTVETQLLATDQQRTVLSLLDAAQANSYVYTPYGHRPLDKEVPSVLGFNGEYPDQLTGHYLLGKGYRAFNPVLKIFNKPDSWSPFGRGGINAYAYCEGDPVNLSDPTGHNPLAKFMPAIKQWRAKAQISRIYAKAGMAKEYIDAVSSRLAEEFGGGIITTGLKSKERILEKVNTRLGGYTQGVLDVARNTLVVEQSKIGLVVESLREKAMIISIKAGSRANGYSGVHAYIKTPSGIYGEIQVQPPSMVYSMYSEDIARNALGDSQYNALNRHAQIHGYQGGMAHEFYENARSSHASLAERNTAVRENRDYFSFMRDGFVHL